MKKIILIFFFVFSFLKADYLYIGYYMDATAYSGVTFFDKDYRSRCYPQGDKLKIGKDIYLYSQKTSYPHLGTGKTYIPQFEPDCLVVYAVRKCSWDHTPYTPGIAGFWEGNYMYCLKKEGYIWSKALKAWVNSTTHEIICPDGMIEDNGQCVTPPKCTLTCPADKQLDKVNCVCKCYFPMVLDQTGHCVPNPDINKSECESKGYVYVDATSFEVFTDLDKAIASLGGSGCFSKDWVNAKKDALKAKLSPENVLKSAFNLLPLGKLYKLAKWTGLIDDVVKEVKNPKVLTDNKPVIETKYNPETGVYEPKISLEPRIEKLPEEKIFQAPETSESAEQIIKPTKELDDFLRSKFAEVDTDEGLTQAVTAYNLEKNPARTAVIDDLRDLFKRKPETQEQHFPVVINDIVSGEPINAQVTRQVTPVSTEGKTKTYNITYNITPQGAKTPLPVVYEAQVSPDPQDSRKQVVKVIPKYNIENKTVTGTEIKNIYNIKTTTTSPTPAEQNIPKPDLTSFGPLAKNEINNALNYKINLFTCPPATPKCPNDLVINYDLAGVKGQYKLPDITCAVINAIDNPNISPVIDKAATLIVLFATAVGFLSLLRRD